MRKAIVLTLIAAFALAVFAPRSAAGARLLGPLPGGKIDPDVQTRLDTLPQGEMMTVIVTLNQQADLKNIPGADKAAQQQGVIRALQATALTSQASLRASLATQKAQGKVSEVTSF